MLPDPLPRGVVAQTAHGVTYGMWASPDKIGRFFSMGRLYEEPLLEWVYQQRLDGVAIDVGANIGNHTLWFAAVCGMQVQAFEPVLPHVVGANVYLNGLQNRVAVHAFGLGDSPATYHHVAKGVLQLGESGQSTDEVVAVETMDSIEVANVSLIKIDVEGMELNVLRGGLGMIERWRPVVITEEWSGKTTKGIEKTLGGMGYRRIQGFGGRGRAPMGVWRAK